MIDVTTMIVEGEKKDKKVFLYALSTCGWCKQTKSFLKENGVEYEYIDVDKVSSEERKKVVNFLKEKKVSLGFPITIIDEEKIINGYKPEAFKEALGL